MATGDTHLRKDSPCINTGVNGGWTTTYAYDLDGNPRILDTTVDMGAYEYAIVPPFGALLMLK